MAKVRTGPSVHNTASVSSTSSSARPGTGQDHPDGVGVPSWPRPGPCATRSTTATVIVFELCERYPKRSSGGRAMSRQHADNQQQLP
jgi:hypothetical protein